MAATAIQLILVGTIVAVFLARSRYTFLDNYWQAIAQLDSPESRTITAGSGMATDREVKQRLMASGGQTARVGIGQQFAGDSSKIALVGGRLRRRPGW